MLPKIQNILYASDLSDNSAPALAWAILLAHRNDARVTFLHVIEEVYPQATLFTRSILGEDKWKGMSDGHRDQAHALIKERIEHFCENVLLEMSSCPFTVTDIIINRGVPVEIILKQTESNNYDVVTMGALGAGAFKKATVGRTARRVLRGSRFPVFVVPVPQQKTSPASMQPVHALG
jgi:nucleotide-binding universal stress UspA family protein